MKSAFYFIMSSLLFSSCVMHNRMTSPEVLSKEEQTWSFGAVTEPALYEDEYLGAFSVQPVITYRTGLGGGSDIGMTVYGVYTPGLVFDWKHSYLDLDNFKLSGDLALFGGFPRPSGVQYEMIFGKREIYGTVGANVDLLPDTSYPPSWIIGFGSQFSEDSKVGFQMTYGRQLEPMKDEYDDSYNWLTIGLSMNFQKKKKKFRSNPSKQDQPSDN